ncbi:protein Star-like [Tigriopus californicus]|nr:protein Star-like [Tigriopus californicus]
MERHLGWTGLLIEADQIAVPDLVGTNRQSWMVPNCLSVSPQVSEVTFGTKYNYGRILHTEAGKTDNSMFSCNHHTVICYPIYAILAAVNQTKVDYFSLDVEGFELDILKTIPFDQVEITALSVEFTYIGNDAASGTLHELEIFMADKGYKLRAKVLNGKNYANDYIYVKNGFNEDVHLEDVVTDM